MLDVFRNCPPIVSEAKKAKFRPSFLLQVLIFIGIYIATQILQLIPAVAIGMFFGFRAVIRNEVPAFSETESVSQSEGMLLITLFGTVIVTAAAILYCKFLEKRSLHSMGFTKKRLFFDYGVGLLTGFAMISACVFISWTGGALTYKGFTFENNTGILFAFLLGFIVQGMSEEVLLRGYLMISVAARNSIALAVFTNSVLFALLHIFNSGISVLAIINLTLFGVFASLYVLKTNSIWGICALHSMWNFAQGNIYGIRVSGIDTGVSVFSFIPKEEGTLLNGGKFGLEGGLAVTTVLCISIIVIILMKGPTRNQVPEPQTPLS